MLQSLSIIALAATAAYAAPSTSSTSASRIQINKVTHYGSGCPQGTDVPVSTDGNNIISHFPGFAINPSVQSQSSIFCGLTLDIACAPGQQFSVASSSYHDYLEVSAGSTGSHILSYWFQSNPIDVAETRHDFAGYIRGGVDVMDIVPGTDRVWSRCGDGGTLVFTNRGAVTGGGGGRSVFNDGAVTTNIEWRSC